MCVPIYSLWRYCRHIGVTYNYINIISHNIDAQMWFSSCLKTDIFPTDIIMTAHKDGWMSFECSDFFSKFLYQEYKYINIKHQNNTGTDESS